VFSYPPVANGSATVLSFVQTAGSEYTFKSNGSQIWRAGADETGHRYVIAAPIDF
jgi:hypothetical protein